MRQLEKQIATIGRKYVLALMSGKEFPSPVEKAHLYDLLGMPMRNHDKYEGNESPELSPAWPGRRLAEKSLW